MRPLEYDWVVQPGADAGKIALDVEGARGATIDADGNLVLQTAVGKVVQRAPVAYQDINGQRQPVATSYVLNGSAVGVTVGSYDATKPLIIDPVLSYGTYLGGSNDDFGMGIAVDNAGNAYATGFASSSDFPTTTGAYSTTNTSPPQAFVSKLNATGTALTQYDGDNRTPASVSTTPGVTGTTTLTTTSQFDPDGNTLAQTVQTRDPSGNVQTFADSATFDRADRQTSATDNGQTTSYGYDAAGQERTCSLLSGVITTTLDAAGHVTALAENADGTGPYTGVFLNYNDAAGQPRTFQLGNGVVGQRSFDGAARPTGVRYIGGPDLSTALTYDSVGRVASTTTLSGTDTLTYDAQNRLRTDCGPQVVIKGGDGCYHYSYDADGNLLSASDDQVGVTDLYTYTNPLYPLQPDQQSQGGATTAPATATIAFGYDASGHTTSISDPVALTDPTSAPYKKDARNDSFGYDPLGRVVRVTRLESTKINGGADTLVTPFTATIAYNAQGLRSDYLLTPDPRTGKQPVDTRFSYQDGELTQAVVIAVTGTLYTNTFVYGPSGEPYELIRTDPTGTNRYWYATDAQGSVVALLDSKRVVVDCYEYNAWGETVTDDKPNEMVPQQLRYKGYYYDEALTYDWTGDGRYYDPEAMRYLQPDAPGGSYAYAGDDPLDKGGMQAQFRGSTIGYSGIRPHAGSYNPSPSGVCEIPIVGGLVCPQPVPSYQEARHRYLLSVGGIFYRGATSDNPKEIWALQPSEAKKIAAGKFDRGVSVFTNPDKIPPRFHKVWKVFGDGIRMNGLDIKQIGQPEHFEITPTGPSTLEDYQVKLESLPIVLYAPGEELENPRDRG